MLLGDAVMLFHRKMRHYKKYRALTDTDPLVTYKGMSIPVMRWNQETLVS